MIDGLNAWWKNGGNEFRNYNLKKQTKILIAFPIVHSYLSTLIEQENLPIVIEIEWKSNYPYWPFN
jgi:hypothetical protein